MKRTIIILGLMFFIIACAEDKTLTVEKWCKIQKKIADIGMKKYFDAFNNKSYEEMAKSYEQYVKDSQKVYQKYNVTSFYLNEWEKEHKQEISSFLESHEDLDFKKNYGEKYNQFVLNVFRFLEEKVQRETESQ